jgi:MarR family transcriptional regulator, organic hydroperoxide resistance regulator
MKELNEVLQQFLYLNRPSRNSGDLSVGERMVMMALNKQLSEDKKGMLPSELSIHMGLSRSAVTPLLNSLESKKYLIREVNPDDRRQILITINPLKPSFHQQRQKQLEQMITSLTKSEQDQLCDLIEKLNEAALETRGLIL